MKCCLSAISVISVVSSLLLLSFGCKNIVEADSAFRGLLYVYNGDLEELCCIEINEPPGSVQPLSGLIMVATREGNLLCFDSESYEFIEEYKVGPASPEGYTEMIQRTGSNSVYLTGAFGNVLQVSVSSGAVQDMFRVCQLPENLTIGGVSSEYFFLTDGITNNIIRVRLLHNKISGLHELSGNIRCVANHSTDSILVSISGETKIVFEISPGYLASTPVFLRESVCLASVPGADYSVAVIEDTIGTVNYHITPDSTGYGWFFENKSLISGSPRYAVSDNMFRTFVLSSAENQSSILTGYLHGSGYVSDEIPLQGIPMDIKFSSGVLYVLTAIE